MARSLALASLIILLTVITSIHAAYGYAIVTSVNLTAPTRGMVYEQLAIEAEIRTGNNLVEYVHNVSATLLLPPTAVLISGSNPQFIGQMGPGPAYARCQWSVEFEEAGSQVITVNVSFIDTQKIPRFLSNSTSIAIFGPPHVEFVIEPVTTAQVDTKIFFNATASQAQGPDIQIDTYAWDFGDGAQETGISPIVMHVYQLIGNYTVSLNVTDNGPYKLSASNSTVITIILFGDLNSDGKVNIVDITIVAQAFASTPETPTWNPIADLNTDGAVNIVDITLVAAEFGTTE